MYFNPLPRKEGDKKKRSEAGKKSVISIHSLVKRETGWIYDKISGFGISIHSLVKRETVLAANRFNGS